MCDEHRISVPLNDDAVLALNAGDRVLLSGVILGARDAAHARLVDTLDRGERLPVDVQGQVIYYVGPAPAKAGFPIGSAGPTTSGRMDRYAPRLYAAGVKATIGKGYRSPEVRAAIAEHNALYLAAVGGTGALLSRRIVRADIVAYPELGPEALYALEVVDFPTVVVNDARGADLYEDARRAYRLSTSSDRSGRDRE